MLASTYDRQNVARTRVARMPTREERTTRGRLENWKLLWTGGQAKLSHKLS